MQDMSGIVVRGRCESWLRVQGGGLVRTRRDLSPKKTVFMLRKGGCMLLDTTTIEVARGRIGIGGSDEGERRTEEQPTRGDHQSS
jgi:hypothetical protein